MATEKRLIAFDDIFPNRCFYVNAEDPMKSLDELINRINNAPTVDAVEVVRCKDCKHRHTRYNCGGRPMDFFCADGERK